MAQDYQFAELWLQAFSAYRKVTGRDLLLDVAKHPSLQSVEDLQQRIEQRDRNFHAFRYRHAIWDHLRGVLKPVQLFAGLTQTGISLTPFAPASTVLGAALHLISAADGVSATYDAIEALLKDIMDITKRIEVYSRDTMDPSLRQIVVKIICKLLEILARAEKLAKRSRFREYASTTLLGKDGKVQSLIDELNKLTDVEAKLVVTLINETTLRIKKTGEVVSATTDRLEKGIEANSVILGRIEEKIDEGRLETKETEDQKALAKLLGHEVFERTRDLFLDINEERMTNSGDWLLEEPLFQRWINQQEPLLWIFGKPGSGKTFLSSKIIDHLQSEEMSSTTFVAYFFIKEDNQELRSIDSMLKSIALQITQIDLPFRKHVSKVCKNSETLRNPKTFWKTVFRDFFGSPLCPSSAFIVFDGLDEAHRRDREILLEFLHELHSLRASFERPKIQVAIVGRPDLQNDIRREWEELVEYVDVSVDRTTDDLEAYIMREVEKVQMLRSKRLSTKDKNSLRQFIADKLVEGADGMFQWIKVVLAEIKHKKVRTDIVIALKSVPTDLLEMVGRIFDRITKDKDFPQDYLKEMILWIACAKRPLTLGELQELIVSMPREGGDSSPDSGASRTDIEGEWPDFETDMRTSFASFLTLTRADGKTTETLQKECIASLNRKHKDEDEQGSKQFFPDENEIEQFDGREEDAGPSSEFRGEFHSNPTTTEIQFTHASIRDFLFRKQSLMPEYVRVDRNQAHAHIAMACLVTYRDWRTDWKNGRGPYSYAYWADHLAEADVTKVQLEDRARLLELLCQVLHRPNNAHLFFELGMRGQHSGFQDICETLMQVMIDWGREDALSTLSSEERSWIIKARTSRSTLFECVVPVVFQEWLQTWSPHFQFNFCSNMELLLACFPLHDEPKATVVSRTSIINGPIYPSGTIRRLAQASNFDQDSRWHTGLGGVLTMYGYLEDGREEFTLALQLDPDNFRARMWLAKVYGKQGKLKLAIETSLAALNQCPEDQFDLKANIWCDVRDWRRELDDESGTVEAIKASFAIIRDEAFANRINFRTLHDLRQYQLIIDMAKTLEERPSRRGKGGQLNAFIRESYPYVILGHAAKVLGELDYVDRIFRRAISNASQEDDISSEREQRAHYAWFVFAFMRDETEALEISKALVSEFLTSPTTKGVSSWVDHSSRFFAEGLLVQIYLRNALAAYPQTSTIWITELQNLVKQLQDLQFHEAEASVLRGHGSSAMGLWHRIHGQPEVARKWLRERVLEGIQMLTDGDPDDYNRGYLTLGGTLLTFGDRRNASIAFAVLMMRPSSLQKIQQQDRMGTSIPINRAEATLTQPSTEPLDPTSAAKAARNDPAGDGAVKTEDIPPYMHNRCTGQCGRKFKTWTAYFRCEYCFNTGFCDECAELVKASKFPFVVCDSSHPFLQIYPVDMELACAGAFVENGTIVPRADWLISLWQEWTA